MGQSHHTLLHLEPCPVQTHSSTEKSVFITLPDIVSPSADLLTDNNTSGWYDNKSQSFRLVAKNIFISSSTVLTARLKTWTYNKVNMIINSSFWYSRIRKKEGQTLFYLLTVLIDASSHLFCVQMMMAMVQPPLARFPAATICIRQTTHTSPGPRLISQLAIIVNIYLSFANLSNYRLYTQ